MTSYTKCDLLLIKHMLFISVHFITFSRSLYFREMSKFFILLALSFLFIACSAQSTYISLNDENFKNQIDKGNTVVVFVNGTQ